VTELVLAQLVALLLVLFVVSSGSQVVMSRLGHRLVYALRTSFVKRILDTDVERFDATVLSDFRLFGQLLGPNGEASESEVKGWLERLRILEKVRVEQGIVRDPKLSQGQRKRLALVVALLEERPVLLLDEWAADQDPGFRRLFYRELLPALREAGRTVIAITHDDAYFDVADRVLRLSEGQLGELRGLAPRRGASVHALHTTGERGP
jgi:putative ATP-binding cassette transporter